MKYAKQFKKAVGLNALGYIDFPVKISNIKVSRIRNTDKTGGCSFCFPHGYEATNATCAKNTRNWKHHRKHQWKHVK